MLWQRQIRPAVHGCTSHQGTFHYETFHAVDGWIISHIAMRNEAVCRTPYLVPVGEAAAQLGVSRMLKLERERYRTGVMYGSAPAPLPRYVEAANETCE